MVLKMEEGIQEPRDMHSFQKLEMSKRQILSNPPVAIYQFFTPYSIISVSIQTSQYFFLFIYLKNLETLIFQKLLPPFLYSLCSRPLEIICVYLFFSIPHFLFSLKLTPIRLTVTASPVIVSSQSSSCLTQQQYLTQFITLYSLI